MVAVETSIGEVPRGLEEKYRVLYADRKQMFVNRIDESIVDRRLSTLFVMGLTEIDRRIEEGQPAKCLDANGVLHNRLPVGLNHVFDRYIEDDVLVTSIASRKRHSFITLDA